MLTTTADWLPRQGPIDRLSRCRHTGVSGVTSGPVQPWLTAVGRLDALIHFAELYGKRAQEAVQEALSGGPSWCANLLDTYSLTALTSLTTQVSFRLGVNQRHAVLLESRSISRTAALPAFRSGRTARSFVARRQPGLRFFPTRTLSAPAFVASVLAPHRAGTERDGVRGALQDVQGTDVGRFAAWAGGRARRWLDRRGRHLTCITIPHCHYDFRGVLVPAGPDAGVEVHTA